MKFLCISNLSASSFSRNLFVNYKLTRVFLWNLFVNYGSSFLSGGENVRDQVRVSARV